MKTTYELLSRSNPNRGFTDRHGTFDTRLEAARAVTNPQDWKISPNPGYWYTGPRPDGEWLIAERAVPENIEERVELALELCASFGQTDGDHHKMWVIDQTVRLLTGDAYEEWLVDFRAGEDGPDTYTWDEGIAP
jgi:hypothetical protein